MRKFNTFLLVAFVMTLVSFTNVFAQFKDQINPLKTGENFVINHQRDHTDLPGIFVSGNSRYRLPQGQGDAMNQYSVVYTTGITYNSISGTGNSYSSWRNATSTDDNLSVTTPIGFTFVYNGVPYTTFAVSTNGFLTLNAATVATGSGNLAYGYDNTQFTSTTGTLTTVAGFYDDLVCQGNPGTLASLNASLKYLTTGVAPNRILTAEWIGFEQFGAPGPNLNWQVKLYETDGHIECVYGTMDPTGSTGFTYSLGINAQTLSAVPTAAELLEQQVNNTNNFSNTIQNAQTVIPANNTQLTFNTPSAPNGSPTNLTFSAVTASGMTLTWNDNSSNELGFPVYSSTDNINFNYIGSAAASGGSSQSLVVSGLTPSTLYYFRVYASTEGRLSSAFANGQQSTLATSPVCGTKTIGPGGNYPTITAGVADILASGMCGAAIFELLPAYTSGSETFPLSFSSISGILSSTNTLTIRPQTGATSRVITSANTTATVDLNGCSYVTFDGRQGGAGTNRDLQLDNTSVSGAVVRFINSENNCALRYCTVTGVCTSTVSGDLFFSTSNGISLGNSNNTIDNCDIKDGATQPVNLIYSSGTGVAGLMNSSNTISNCFLSNFFSAASVTNGIFLTTGSSAWSITGNRIFQTAPRTYTSGNIHDAITITSSTAGAGGFTISNNIIGFATSAGTGTYTMLGTLANRFICINVTQSVTGAVSSIQGNIMTNFSLASSSGAATTNGVWCGISLQSGDFNIGTTAGNFIGDAVSNGAISTTITTGGGLTVGINDASTGNVTINNTTIGSITAVGTTVSITPAITGIQVTNGIPTITNNTIGSSSVANSINTGALAYTNVIAGTVLGINVTTVTGATNINNNIISNLSNSGTSTLHATRGIIYASTSPITINNNTISNLQCAGSLAGATGLAEVNGIVVTGAALGGCTIKGNTISTLNSSNAGVFATATVGIAFSNPASIEVSFNKIWDLRNASTMTVATTPPLAIGLQFRAGPDSARIYNNMVSLGNSQTTNTEFIGILNNFSTVAIMKTSFNSVNIEGSAAAGSMPSYCFYRGDFGVGSAIVTPVIIYNNLLNNSRNGGAGKHYAIGNQQSSPSSGWVAANVNNNAFNSAAATTIGLWSVADQTFAQWKANSLGDGSSISGISVIFTASATGNLHLNMGVTPTALESGGIPYAGITTDIDGQVRPGPAGSVNGGAFAPDIGADEFDGVPTDIIPPVITYTALGNGPVATNRSFNTITISDPSGININPGTKPRCYYKKSTDANDLTGWKYVEANGTTSPFDFTIDYTLLNAGSVSAGDIIQYFVVAQDNAATPNVAINSGTFAAAPSSVALTNSQFPLTGTINQYTIITNVYTGGYTIGAGLGNTWQSFTNAGGFFDAINQGVISGNISVQVTTDLIGTETGAITLNPIAETGAGGYTVTITPQTPSLKTISGNPGGTIALMKLNGVKRVTFDGRFNGGGPSYLTFANTNIAASTGGETFLMNNGSNNILLEYLTIQGNVQYGGGGVVNIAGTNNTNGNTNITVDNCNISNFTGSNPYWGVTSFGQSQSINNTNINITNNNIFDWGVNLGTQNSFGVFFQGTSGSTVSGNSIYRTSALNANAVLNDFIVQTVSGTGAGNTFSGNYIGGNAPLCGGAAFTSSTASGLYCIDLIDISLQTTATTVANNTIKNFSVSSTTSTTGSIVYCGIFNRTGAGACTISGNQIGDNTVDASVSPSILFTNSSAGLTFAVEPIDSRAGNGAISNNNIGGIRSVRTSTGLTSLNLIFSGTQGTKNITGNLIGSSSSQSRPNRLSQQEIDELKKLPNYPPGETAPVKSDNKYITTSKSGGMLIVGEINDAVADNVGTKADDKKSSMNEKLKIEQDRMNGKTTVNNNDVLKNGEMNVTTDKLNETKEINLVNLPKVDNIKSGKERGDNPQATIANISMEAPTQLVPIFSSAFGGTISNNTIANLVINTGAVTAPVVNLINLSNASSPSTNMIVTNNTIRNISFLNSVAATLGGCVLTTTYPGTLTCTGNNINTILAAPVAAAAVGFVCIQSTGTGFHNVSSNTISGLSLGGNESGAPAFTGILETNTAPATATVNSNIIQNITLNSLIASTHTFNAILGNGGTGDYQINNNTITNITTNSNSTNTTSSNVVFTGVFSTMTSSTNTSSANTISGNTITNITCNPFTALTAITARGIFQNSSTGVSNVTKNFISNISTNSTSNATVIYGWFSFFGQRTTLSNNIIDLGSGITVDADVEGMRDFSDETQGFFYNNTVRVRGTIASGTVSTAGYFRQGTSNVTDMRNNIFSNERTGGTGLHLAVNNTLGPSGWTSSNYNDYYSANASTIATWNSAIGLTLAQWKTNSGGQDARTFSNLPSFTGTDRINASDLSVSGRGTYVSTITTDIDGNSRPTSMSTTVKPVDVGASQTLPSGFVGNNCVLNGAIYQDGGLNSVEIVSGAFNVTSVLEYPGVRSPHNTFGKPGNGNGIDPTNSNKNNIEHKPVKERDGKSGGAEMFIPVNEPWIYWELAGFTPTTEPITIRFYYNPEMLATITESTLRVTYWTGSAWENTFGPQSINTVSHYIQVQLPAGYSWQNPSHFAIEGTASPLPVNLCSFDANTNQRDINLSWRTCDEVNNKGFGVERRTLVDSRSNTFTEWAPVSFVNGHGTTNEPQVYAYKDARLNTGKYQYRLRQEDYNGNVEYFNLSNAVEIGKPLQANVSQNYPNPSNPKSKIDYQIPFSGKVTIKVYDLLGKEITTIVNEVKDAGFYTAEFDGTNLASGVYLYRISAEGENQKYVDTKKMILVK